METQVESHERTGHGYVSTGHLPSPEMVKALVSEAYERFKSNGEGRNSDVYPALAGVSSDLFGVCMVDTNGNVHAVLLKPDGECDTTCEASMAEAQKNATATPRTMATTMTALQDSTPSTVRERLQNRMNQRYQVPGRR